MNISKQKLKNVNINQDIVLDVGEISVNQILTAGIEIGSVEGVSLFAPNASVVSVATDTLTGNSVRIASISVDDVVTEISALAYSNATSSDAGLIKVNGTKTGNNYALKLDEEGFAYVNVPWTDKFCTSAWYDIENKQICLSVGPSVLSVNVADLVKTYEADGTTTELNGNKFSVKSGVYADSIMTESKHMNLDDYTLGGYLSVLTQNLGGTCTDK